MSHAAIIHTPKQSNNPVTTALQEVLANTYSLYLTTHNYHWNVEGEYFVSLHRLFGEQYNEQFLAIDRIAEHIRALGDYALPFEGETILQLSKMTSNALNKEDDAIARAERMLHNLVALTQAAIDSCQKAKVEAVETEDDETENLLVERVTAHKKALWMLGSFLKA
jgi:starvation-inducible DNA-binding protein